MKHRNVWIVASVLAGVTCTVYLCADKYVMQLPASLRSRAIFCRNVELGKSYEIVGPDAVNLSKDETLWIGSGFTVGQDGGDPESYVFSKGNLSVRRRLVTKEYPVPRVFLDIECLIKDKTNCEDCLFIDPFWTVWRLR